MKCAAAATVLGLLLLIPISVRAASLTPAASVSMKQPAPGAQIRTFYPVLSARIEHAHMHSMHLFVDGRDVTPSTLMSAERLQYIPREHMSGGWHDVFLEGVGNDNRSFSDAWTFETQAPDGDWGTPVTSGYYFLPSGSSQFFPGNFMHFFLIAPSAGFAVLQLCGYGQYPFAQQPYSPVYLVTVPITYTPYNPFYNCTVGAAFTPYGISSYGVTVSPIFIPLPAGIGIFPNAQYAVMHPNAPPIHYAANPRTTLPVYRAAAGMMPIYNGTTEPIYTGRATLPGEHAAEPLPGMYRALPGAAVPAHSIAVPHVILPIPR
jgi:hypothetical protein